MVTSISLNKPTEDKEEEQEEKEETQRRAKMFLKQRNRVKAKLTLINAMKAQRGSRVTALVLL